VQLLPSQAEKVPTFYRIQMFGIVFKTPRRFSPAWAKLFKSFRRICPSLKPYVTLRNTLIILRWGVTSP